MTKHQSVDRLQDNYQTKNPSWLITHNNKEQTHQNSTNDLFDRPVSRKEDGQLPPMSQSISMAVLNDKPKQSIQAKKRIALFRVSGQDSNEGFVIK